ncbi:MAG: cysteine desulfurase NifS [Clostridiales bacterium]|nr:cysteine desulfurase NifS [Clostridiales bacterium]
MIYLDNAGTTKVGEEVVKSMLPFFDEFYGNASSLHTAGQIAKEHLENAREKVAKCINAEPNEIYFTSGGSESDNWAIHTACRYGELVGKKHIITSAIEHHAVLHTLDEMKKRGFEITYLPVYENGIVKVEDLKNAITDNTCLVTIMFANNEVGTIQPISQIGEVCKQHNVIFHTDAVQAVGHIPVNVKAMNIDMLSLSGHKFHASKGVGALYVKRGKPLFNFVYGGAQEGTKRAGTENLASIVGMATALEIGVSQMEQTTAHETQLRDMLFKQLSKIPHSKINGDLTNRLPNNFNMSFEGIEGESLLLLLDDAGICASSGSACTSGSLDPSHVLLAIGLPHEIAHGSLRLTLSKYTTLQEIEQTIKIVPEVVEKLRSYSPVWNSLQKGEKQYVIQ